MSRKRFFQDAETFDYLSTTLVPGLFTDKSALHHLRVWCVDCSSGEQAYSIAMLLLEHASVLSDPPLLQVFASDLRLHALSHARAGVYPASISRDVSPERLDRFFVKQGASYRVCEEVRRIVLFAVHHVLEDPPIVQVQMVICRSVLEDLPDASRDDALERFHRSLGVGGRLVLDLADSIDQSALYRAERAQLGIFQSHADERADFPPAVSGGAGVGAEPGAASGPGGLAVSEGANPGLSRSEASSELSLEDRANALRALVESSSEVAWVTFVAGVPRALPQDRSGVEPPALRILCGRPRDRRDELVAGPLIEWRDCVHSDDRDFVIDAWARAVASESPLDIEVRAIPDGDVSRWIRICAVPVGRDSVAYRMWAGLHSDVTDRRHVEWSLRAADERKDEFLAMLGHELRSPLAPLDAAVELLRDRLAPEPELVRIRDLMARQPRVLARLVDDLLDVSRIKSGRIELQRERVALHSAIEDALANVGPLVASMRHRVVLSLDADRLEVDADPLRLGQILNNLLENAAKYTPENGEIRVSTRRRGAQAVIVVADDGIGIEAHALDRIFEAFAQIHPTRDSDRARRGLGLGLALVERLVKLHGGGIAVSSAGLDRGTEFVVHLPLATPARRAEPQPTLPELSASARAEEVRSCRILVVDDDEDAAEAMVLVLSRDGHEVRAVHDPEHALELASEFCPEVVLLDVELPHMDGYELAHRLRSLDATAAALLIAASGHAPRTGTSAEVLAIDHHLVKPIDRAQLRELLVTALVAPMTPRA